MLMLPSFMIALHFKLTPTGLKLSNQQVARKHEKPQQGIYPFAASDVLSGAVQAMAHASATYTFLGHGLNTLSPEHPCKCLRFLNGSHKPDEHFTNRGQRKLVSALLCAQVRASAAQVRPKDSNPGPNAIGQPRLHLGSTRFRLARSACWTVVPPHANPGTQKVCGDCQKTL